MKRRHNFGQNIWDKKKRDVIGNMLKNTLGTLMGNPLNACYCTIISLGTTYRVWKSTAFIWAAGGTRTHQCTLKDE